MNVLVVDDNETNRKLLRVLFKGHNIGAIEAADGVEALSALRTEKIDVIVSDILMPNMDGFRLCFEVRHDEALCDVGVILYTATDFTLQDEKRAFELGADRFLKKQGSTVALLDAVKETTEDIRRTARRHAPLIDEYPELQVMKEYSQTMIIKLEDKSIELENAKEELRKANEILEQQVRERTAALENSNKELESFSYSVSHDLRAPLRWINAYSGLLAEECGEGLSQKGKEYLDRIQAAQKRMSQLIEDLMGLARVARKETHFEQVDLSAIATEIVDQLASAEPGRGAEVTIKPGLLVRGDRSLLRVVLENLIDNAWKYSGQTTVRRFEFASKIVDDIPTFFVRDNGVGFDMEHAKKLFDPFQRLHSDSEFPGTGIGLATVQRVIRRHGGNVWADSARGQGATFYFTIPETCESKDG